MNFDREFQGVKYDPTEETLYLVENYPPAIRKWARPYTEGTMETIYVTAIAYLYE